MEGNHKNCVIKLKKLKQACYISQIGCFLFWKCQEQLSFCRFLPLASPLSSAPLLLLPNPGLRGGKGGFGSLLRAIGAQVHFGIFWFEVLCLNVLLLRLRQQPTMRPWGTWPAGGSVMSTMREGSKSKCSIFLSLLKTEPPCRGQPTWRHCRY